ncbi:ATP-binding cassette domain-containing protein [Pedobacter psychroterrae]|uniref:ATP-binding cassette domain-containing protein n=1 Tax=Pedobacter psychroterrae TaxID=2530453 RepID=A0A4R0NNW1_9SPHI|nr:ATP-binding cassette domain-containing protein [Pedobacter psychroterrae]TCD00875.1 ATP-binding cassette domain-containing protein [Pedobacter psychroterrae]
MSVKVRSVSKHYGKQKAVDSISFDAAPGRILGFLGPNGAGKSTTMKMLSSYLMPDSGSASICGYDTQGQSLEVKRLIGYLPENTPLYLDMYVKEFLSFVANSYQLSQTAKKINDVIEQVGLQSEQHKKIGMLSKGYKQRVGLAQAIIHDPKVLILDEPTSGLDPNQLLDIRSLIKSLGTDKTVILSTHIMQEVEAICDDVIIINKGKIVADTSIESLIAQHGPLSLEDIFRNITV